MKLVMIVEDEHGNAEILRLLLESSGYRVTSASNGKAALTLLAGERPSLILSDYMMPHMNGAELGHAVRAEDAWKDIPFVFMSGTSEEVVRAEFTDYDAFITKPIVVDSMLQVIDKLSSEGRRDAEVHRSISHLLKGILPPD